MSRDDFERHDYPVSRGEPSDFEQSDLEEPDIRRPDIASYLPQAILCTLFCCLPFGIVAIVHAAQVNGHLNVGKYDAARKASDEARKWCWISFLIGLVATPIVVYLQIQALQHQR
jgi:hypothetical protein